MLNRIFAITQFKNIWLVLPLLLAVLYVPQALWGLHIFGDKSAVQLILIIAMGLAVYLGTYFILWRIDAVPSSMLRAGDSLQWSATYFVPIVSVIYFALIGYVLFTAQKIALLEAFRGASQDDIAFAREALFKTREGWEKILPYLNAIFSSALMPFALVLSYVDRRRYRHYLLFLFCLSLLPSLEKALILKAMVPLIMLALNGYFPIKRVFQFVAVSTLVIAGAFMLTKSGEGNNLDENVKALKLLQSQKAVVDKLKSDRQSVIDGTGEDEISRALKQLYGQKSNLEKLKRQRQNVMNGKGEDEISRALKQLYGQKSNLEKLKRQRQNVMNGKGEDEISKALKQLYVQKSNLEKLRRDQQNMINDAARKAWTNLLEQEKVIDKQLEYYVKADREAWPNLLEQEKIIDRQLDYYIKVDRELLPSLRQQEKNIDAQMKYYKWVDSHRHKYNALGFGRVAFVINRVLWIPYVTAYDWLGYFDQHLKGQFLHGATSSLVSRISGAEPFPMEKEVFKYQFGTGGPQTAAANATFLVDAFVNFGWFGVAFYSFLLAALIYLITVVGNPAMQACSYYFLIQISMGGLPGVFFSNGMLLLILLSFFIKPKRAVEVTGKTSAA
ncbi:MAG TPA: hypothetical protein VE934_07740 [Polaromonas sp.]|uniref:hypothetical protein n=1 Tax=Polaromonas sp. TaxID=1869339 RepID=UPI002D483956|nr:hypothetical protein [Polaromonas sp.]HYW56836.1 hypothetical protein [Polaromonas sp.]